MLEIEVTEVFQPDRLILDIIKDYEYTVTSGEIRNLLKTNLQIRVLAKLQLGVILSVVEGSQVGI